MLSFKEGGDAWHGMNGMVGNRPKLKNSRLHICPFFDIISRLHIDGHDGFAYFLILSL
jgi:hypothetical protein